MQRQLVVIAGPEKGRTFPLADGQTVVIGRGEASDTKLNDARMSRVHCRVHVDGGKTLLEDAGSAGGTFVEGGQVTECELQPGNVFQVGDTHIRYQIDAEREASTIVGAKPGLGGKPLVETTSLADLVGQTLAHYELNKIVHKGNTSMLFRAHDGSKNRTVAVKVLSPEFTSNDDERDRFVRAMQTMLNFRHENVVQLYHAGKQGPYCWCAMEYIEGPSIMEIIDLIGVQGMLDWREAYRVAVHIGRALEAAYEKKIIHRNVTPQNMMQRANTKETVLCDMMLAKALEGTQARQITQPGQLVGDVAYMSPERTRSGADVDGRSDIYGLGAAVYALLTGRPPFESDSLPELVKKVREETPVKPKEIQLSINDKFQDVVLQMLEKRPDDRFQTPFALLSELERVGKYAGLEADWNFWN